MTNCEHVERSNWRFAPSVEFSAHSAIKAMAAHVYQRFAAIVLVILVCLVVQL